MTVSVIVPTYNRLDDLRRCLAALAAQSRLAEEVIVIVRDTDEITQNWLDAPDITFPDSLQTAITSVPGQVAALNVGLEAASGDIIAITDDDAAPRPDWLARIVAHFASDPKVGGVGGRDIVHHPTPQGIAFETETRQIVGIVTWWGKLIGGHHLGIGPARDVDFFKGANMSYRRGVLNPPDAPPIRFDTRLRGAGAQVHNDLAFALTVRRAGWRMVYDPAVIVDHFEAVRFDSDARGKFNAEAHSNGVFNETLTLLAHLPRFLHPVYFLYSFTVGSRYAPGLGQITRLMLRREPNLRARWQATQQGRIAALANAFRRPETPNLSRQPGSSL